MKRILSTLAAAAILTGGMAALPNEASAQAGCVSQAEFRQVKRGMSKAKVHRIFDTAGRRDAISHGGGFTFEIRSYKACSKYGAVSVGYTNGKLESKAAVF